MTALPYLVRLQQRLAWGLDWLSPERRQCHAEFVLRHQQADGGFRDREGDSDLYYTAFAVRTLALLDGLSGAVDGGLVDYLAAQEVPRLGVIDLMNWSSMAVALQAAGMPDPVGSDAADVRNLILARFESVRCRDGGYAKSPEGASSSTYHTFLVITAADLFGAELPDRNRLIQFLYDRQRDDGGFVEIAPMKRSGTNPTAAAAASLELLGAMDDELRDDVAAFLTDVRASEGGFCANSRIPFADALSSFTGLLTLMDLDRRAGLDLRQTCHWVESQLEFPTGGFRAATWDEQADVEYTFYALGLLSLIHQMQSNTID